MFFPGKNSLYPFLFTLFSGFLLATLAYGKPGLVPAVSLLLSTTDKIQHVKTFIGEPADIVLPPVEFDGHFWFIGSDTEHGKELWRSDGTSAGTVLAADINLGPEGSFPHSLIVYQNALYCIATDSSNGFELRKTYWELGSSSYRTTLVKDINPGVEDGLAPLTPVVPFKGQLFFAANDGMRGIEVWRSNGTEAGTKRVTDIAPGPESSSPVFMTVLDNPGSLVGDILIFRASDGSSGKELYRIQRWGLDTYSVSPAIDINNGPDSSTPSPLSQAMEFTLYKGELYFSAETNSDGRELWKTNGYAAGTVQVKNIGSGSTDGVEATGYGGLGAEVFEGELYFVGSSGTSDDLWKTDGSGPGTVQAYSSPALPNHKTFLNFTQEKSLLFSVISGVSSGDFEPTLLRRHWDQASLSWQVRTVADVFIYPQGYMFMQSSIRVGNATYFTGSSIVGGEHVYSLFRFDEYEGMRQINRGVSFDSSKIPGGFISFRNHLYFFGENNQGQRMLLKLAPR